MSAVLSEALRHSADGHRAFPLPSGSKVPTLKNWPDKATSDETQLRKWFASGQRNLGLATSSTRVNPSTGETEYLVVLDLDRKHGKDGVESLRALCERNGIDPRAATQTRTQETPTGGYHLLYWASKPIKQGADVLGPGSGVDVRSAGGFIVVAPSVIDGKAYEWVNEGPIAPLGPLEALLAPSGPTKPARGAETLPGIDASAARRQAADYLATAPASVEGEAGDLTAFKVAAKVKDIGTDEATTLDLMAEHWNPRCAPPWSHEDLAAKVAHAYRYGKEPQGAASPQAVFFDATAPTPTAANPAAQLSRAKARLSSVLVADVEAKPIRWFWPGVFALGKCSFIAGAPGLGKSQMTIHLAATATNGGAWPDKSECPQGDVIFITVEDDIADTVRPRLEAAGADLQRVHIVQGVEDVTAKGVPYMRGFDLTRDVGMLDELAQSLKELRLVVIDPVSAFLGDTDSHKNAEVRAAMASIISMCNARDVALLCVSHLSKGSNSPSQSALERMLGSQAFGATARAAYFVTRDKDNPAERVMSPAKNNIAADQLAYYFRVAGMELSSGIKTSRVEWTGRVEELSADEAMDDKKPRGNKVGEAAQLLTDLLRDGPRLRSEVEAAALGKVSEKTLQRAKDMLGILAVKKRGEKHGAWVWSLPGSAVERLPDKPTTAAEIFG